MWQTDDEALELVEGIRRAGSRAYAHKADLSDYVDGTSLYIDGG